MTLTRRARQRMSVGEPAYPASITRDKVYWRQYLGWPSESPQIKIDFSKMSQKPVSEGFVFPKSTEQKLAEAEAKLAHVEAKLAEVEEALKKEREKIEMLKMSKRSAENEFCYYMNDRDAHINELLAENFAIKNSWAV
jgi:hypothetical protein